MRSLGLEVSREELEPHFAIADTYVSRLLDELRAQHGDISSAVAIQVELLGLQVVAASFFRSRAIATGDRQTMHDVGALTASVRRGADEVRRLAALQAEVRSTDPELYEQMHGGPPA